MLPLQLHITFVIDVLGALNITQWHFKGQNGVKELTQCMRSTCDWRQEEVIQEIFQCINVMFTIGLL